MEEKWLVGVDLGGTTIKLAFINVYGEILHKWKSLRIQVSKENILHLMLRKQLIKS